VPKKVVYIEDAEEMHDLVKLVLEDPELVTVAAFDGEAGLATARAVKPDLILLDLFLPDMSGWDVYRNLRADHKLRDVPVIVLSACHEKIAAALGEDVSAGAVDYICKPFSPVELRASVDRALGLS